MTKESTFFMLWLYGLIISKQVTSRAVLVRSSDWIAACRHVTAVPGRQSSTCRCACSILVKKCHGKSMMSKKPVKCANKHTTCAVYRPPFFFDFSSFFFYMRRWMQKPSVEWLRSRRNSRRIKEKCHTRIMMHSETDEVFKMNNTSHVYDTSCDVDSRTEC